jgi:hypothetical protein
MHPCRFVLAGGKVTRLHLDVVLVAKWAKVLALALTVPQPALLVHFVLWTGGMIFFKVLKCRVGKLYVVQLLAIKDEGFYEGPGLMRNRIDQLRYTHITLEIAGLFFHIQSRFTTETYNLLISWD